MGDAFRTLAREVRHEPPKIKGSRFIATVRPVVTAEEAQAFVERVRAEFPDARHTCSAWRLREGGAERFHDDGEPSGSAGRPILQQIEGRELVQVAAAVTRYFGGTKLGVGGLMRAYGGAAGEALDSAEVRTVIVTRRVVVEHPYECSGAVEGLLAATGLEPTSAEYGATVRFAVDVPESEADAFVREVLDRTAGRGKAE